METLPTDPARLQAALERLEAEKERRQQAKIEAGEVVVVQLVVAVGDASEIDAETEKAKANKLAELRSAGEGREVCFDITSIVTGVPRGPDSYEPAVSEGESAALAKSDNRSVASPSIVSAPSIPLGLVDEPVASAATEPSQPASYVFVTTKPATDHDPGEIADGWFSIGDGAVVLKDHEGRHIASRSLREGQNPLDVARQLLRATTARSDFNRRL